MFSKKSIIIINISLFIFIFSIIMMIIIWCHKPKWTKTEIKKLNENNDTELLPF